MDSNVDSRTLCKYGSKCYQKNPQHHKKFKHPTKGEIFIKDESSVPEIPESSIDEPPRKRSKLKDEDSIKNIQIENEVPSPADYVPESSDDEKEEILPSSPLDIKENIKQKFLVEMPQDFYSFWEYCSSRKSNECEDFFSNIGLKLVGPFDVLNGKLKKLDKSKRTESNYLCHWRFYYDPPEFQTLIVGKEDEYRIGYFRDDPSEEPAFVGSMSSVNHCSISKLGPNLFAAVGSYISTKLAKADPFQKVKLKKHFDLLKSHCEEKKISLETKNAAMKTRDKKVVAKSFHGAGIVVPVDKKTEVGYREIPETDADLKKILKKIIDAPGENEREKRFEVLQEIVTNVQWGTDEGDFGMGLELGVDLLVYGGSEFHSVILHLLSVAYDLLNRNVFAQIIKAHLKNRRKGSNMSILP